MCGRDEDDLAPEVAAVTATVAVAHLGQEAPSATMLPQDRHVITMHYVAANWGSNQALSHAKSASSRLKMIIPQRERVREILLYGTIQTIPICKLSRTRRAVEFLNS